MDKSNLIKIPAMAIGATGAILSAYSIVKDGNEKARRETKNEIGENYFDMYVKNLSSSRESVLLEKVKKYVTEKRLDDNFIPFLKSVKNHIISWVDETLNSVVPIALSILAVGAPILFKKNELRINKKIHLPQVEKLGVITSAAAAGALLIKSGILFLHDVFGIGKGKEY